MLLLHATSASGWSALILQLDRHPGVPRRALVALLVSSLIATPVGSLLAICSDSLAPPDSLDADLLWFSQAVAAVGWPLSLSQLLLLLVS